MRRWLLGILALIGTVLLGTAPVLGAMDTAFILEAKTLEEQMRIAENLDVCLTDALESRGRIACFSVREDGWVVIGDNSTDPGRISVFSPDSAFVRGYTFDLDGAYSLGWSGEDILVYSVRGDMVFALSPAGEVTEVCDLAVCEENDAQWKRLRQPVVMADGMYYYIENRVGFWRSTSELIREGASGRQALARITYPSGLFMLPVLVIVAAFGLGIAYRITHPAKRKKTGKPGCKIWPTGRVG